MTKKKISAGVVHEVPQDLRKVLTDDQAALSTWEDITPIARNEWICWIEDAKKAETRARRIDRARQDLAGGSAPLLLAGMLSSLTTAPRFLSPASRTLPLHLLPLRNHLRGHIRRHIPEQRHVALCGVDRAGEGGGDVAEFGF
jgi:hypothetical protein